MMIDKEFLGKLFEQATCNPRLRMNYDLRTTENDGSQRMLNALLPGTEVAIHRHTQSSESVICLCGKIVEILYEEECGYVNDNDNDNENENGDDDLLRGGFEAEVVCRKELREVERIVLCPAEGSYGCVVPKGVWHTVEVLEPSVIFEAKDGKYGEDGSENHNAPSDLKKNIEYLIGKELAEGNQEDLTAEYISKVLGADVDEVRQVLKELL